jgi:hypothetical protein
MSKDIKVILSGKDFIYVSCSSFEFLREACKQYYKLPRYINISNRNGDIIDQYNFHTLKNNDVVFVSCHL